MQTQKVENLNSSGVKTMDSRDSIDVSSDANQYLTFIMAGEEYGVDILCVQEIRGWENATPLPNSPAHIKGVINLRGTIVPIIDLRQCFGLDCIEYTSITVVIVLKVNTGKGSRITGIVVDAVSDVYALEGSEMRAAPDMGSSINTDFIRGLVGVNEKMVILLDIDKLLTREDLSDLSEFSEHLGELN
ncbi:MAG: chemotaxis protein CheW [Alteromonadaceae bacterium]|nr:MAG: chemotaxis protein CheW [Alteromonadaceae bacterium]